MVGQTIDSDHGKSWQVVQDRPPRDEENASHVKNEQDINDRKRCLQLVYPNNPP